MKIKYLFIFFIFGIVLGCSTKSKNVYLSDIEKMELVLDSLHSVAFDSTQRDSKSIVISIHQTMEELKSAISEDTFTYTMIQKIDAYKDIENILDVNSGNLAKAKQAIPEVQKKIGDLKHDIQKGINERDKYEEFLHLENEKIQGIENILSYYLETVNEYAEKYDSLHLQIIHLKDSLIQNNYD